MNLTKSEIQNDIQNFEDSISSARQKLENLPAGQLPYPEHKKRKKRRKELQDDISHFEKIIKIAREALSDEFEK